MSTTAQAVPTNVGENKGTAVAMVKSGEVVRQEFGATSIEKRAETAASVLAAQAQAQILARRMVALQRPRDLDDVRTRIMREVERPGFAAAAWYRKPVGAGVEGLSIRFAEAAMRCMGNMGASAPVIYEDEGHRMERVIVEDFESNVVFERDLMIAKTVERRQLGKGQEALQVRTNSKGETTYLVRATEDDLFAKESALVSKHTRTLILRILPGDIQDDAKRRIKEILHGDAAKDPEGEKKRIADAFASLNVMPADLKRYLGHELSTCSPKELVDLRGLYAAIKAGEATWSEALEGREGTDEPKDPAPPKPGLDGVTEKLQAEKAAAAAAPATTAKPKADAATCPHSSCPPSRIEKLAKGKSIECEDCGTVFQGQAEPPKGQRKLDD